jgi:putative flippase GtrA
VLVQPLRFAVVGVANTVVSFTAYALLVAAGAPYVLAALLAFAAGALNGYVLNRRWTFDARDSPRARLLYVLVQSGGAVATAALVWLAHDAGADRLLAYAVAIPPVTVGTFLANRSWTFA